MWRKQIVQYKKYVERLDTSHLATVQREKETSSYLICSLSYELYYEIVTHILSSFAFSNFEVLILRSESKFIFHAFSLFFLDPLIFCSQYNILHYSFHLTCVLVILLLSCDTAESFKIELYEWKEKFKHKIQNSILLVYVNRVSFVAVFINTNREKGNKIYTFVVNTAWKCHNKLETFHSH